MKCPIFWRYFGTIYFYRHSIRELFVREVFVVCFKASTPWHLG